jgi:LDH2 family malate/lactate/ureidoglycolate dehydrogenase
VVLDCGVTHDIQGNPPHRDEITLLAPGMILRALGFGAICQAWGGLLTGLSLDANRPQSEYADANQGAFLFTYKISLFSDVDRFKREMDDYVQQVRQLKPLKGTQAAYLPGGIEAEQEQAYHRDGIPLSEPHQRDLEKLADELKLRAPWQ